MTCHRINFYEYQPSPFLCLARSKCGLIAAGRSNGSVDVYDENRDFFIVAHFPRRLCCSVESVVWMQSRLFCAGALGRLVELDIQASSIKGSCLLVGSPVARCMTVFEDNIVVGFSRAFWFLFSSRWAMTKGLSRFFQPTKQIQLLNLRFLSSLVHTLY